MQVCGVDVALWGRTHSLADSCQSRGWEIVTDPSQSPSPTTTTTDGSLQDHSTGGRCVGKIHLRWTVFIKGPIFLNIFTFKDTSQREAKIGDGLILEVV